SDIARLVGYFMADVKPSGPQARITSISAGALAMLEAYDWPGNIRQLENAIFRACVLCEGDILTEDEFPQIRAQIEGRVDLDRPAAKVEPAARLQNPDEAANSPAPANHFGIVKALDGRGEVRSLADVELEMIRLAIRHYDGQMSEVAR